MTGCAIGEKYTDSSVNAHRTDWRCRIDFLDGAMPLPKSC